MITVKCATCGQKIFKYIKIGKGELLHCWPDRIVEDYALHDGRKVKCSKCGNIIGVD